MSALQPQPRPHPIHWRTPITMVILLVVLVGGAWWGWNSLTSSSEQNCVEQKLPNNRLVPKQVVVNVYNGGAKAGTAQKTADELRKRGFNVHKVANEPRGEKTNIVAVRGAAAGSPELRLLLGQLSQVPQKVGDARADHTVDLVVGVKYTGLNNRGVTSIAVPADSTVCLPSVRPSQSIPSGENPN